MCVCVQFTLSSAVSTAVYYQSFKHSLTYLVMQILLKLYINIFRVYVGEPNLQVSGALLALHGEIIV